MALFWLVLNPEELGYQNTPILTEADLIKIQKNSDWENIFSTKLGVKFEKEEGKICVIFNSVKDVNLFLFFHGSKSVTRTEEKSLGSLKKMVIPEKSIFKSRLLILKALLANSNIGVYRKASLNFNFVVYPFSEDKSRNAVDPSKMVLIVFNDEYSLVQFLFSPTATLFEVLKFAPHRRVKRVKHMEALPTPAPVSPAAPVEETLQTPAPVSPAAPFKKALPTPAPVSPAAPVEETLQTPAPVSSAAPVDSLEGELSRSKRPELAKIKEEDINQLGSKAGKTPEKVGDGQGDFTTNTAISLRAQMSSSSGSRQLLQQLLGPKGNEWEVVVDKLLAEDIIQLAFGPMSSPVPTPTPSSSVQVVQVLSKTIAQDPPRRAALLSMVRPHLLTLASHKDGHVALLAALDIASVEERELFLARLEEGETLLRLLETDTGCCVAQRMMTWQLSSSTLHHLSKLLVPRLADLACSAPSSLFLQQLVENRVISGQNRLLLKLCSEPLLGLLVHSASGHRLLESVLLMDLGTPTLLVAQWLQEHMTGVVASQEAVSVARTVHSLLLKHAEEEEGENYREMLKVWIEAMTEGERPLVLEAARHPAGHLLVIQMVRGWVRGRERLVEVVRGNLEELAKNVMGCVVVKATQGWL